VLLKIQSIHSEKRALLEEVQEEMPATESCGGRVKSLVSIRSVGEPAEGSFPIKTLSTHYVH
jgi:hypothetical protein